MLQSLRSAHHRQVFEICLRSKTLSRSAKSDPSSRTRSFLTTLQLQHSPENLRLKSSADGNGDENIPLPPNVSSFDQQTEGTKESARKWTNIFTTCGGVPRKEFQVQYSKSSGPGGQHVNKTSTKATVQLPLSCRWVPSWVKSNLRQSSTYYVERTDCLQTSSDEHRSQSQNLEACYRKINYAIGSSAMNAIPKPPDPELQKRIAKHASNFQRANKESKQRSKAVKQGRGKVRPE